MDTCYITSESGTTYILWNPRRIMNYGWMVNELYTIGLRTLGYYRFDNNDGDSQYVILNDIFTPNLSLPRFVN